MRQLLLLIFAISGSIIRYRLSHQKSYQHIPTHVMYICLQPSCHMIQNRVSLNKNYVCWHVLCQMTEFAIMRNSPKFLNFNSIRNALPTQWVLSYGQNPFWTLSLYGLRDESIFLLSGKCSVLIILSFLQGEAISFEHRIESIWDRTAWAVDWVSHQVFSNDTGSWTDSGRQTEYILVLHWCISLM